MALPAAISKAVKEAEKLHAEMYDRQNQEAGTNPEPTDNPVDTQSPEPSQEPTEQAQTDVPADVNTPEGQQDPEGEKDYEQMYKTLKGKYEAEVPRLSQQVANLEGELYSTQSVLSVLGESNEDVPPQRREPEVLISDQEKEDYGPELIEIMKKAAREELGNVVDTLEAENKMLKERFNYAAETSQQSGRERMYNALNSQVENWNEINESPDFLAWLAEPDVLSGVSKQVLLTKAFEENDARRVVMFFKAYLQTSGTPASAELEAQQTQGKKEVQPSVQLDTLVAPKSSSSSVTDGAQQGEKSIWTEAEIAAFYNDVRIGKFKDNPKERERIEKDIIAAASEPGRIRGVNSLNVLP